MQGISDALKRSAPTVPLEKLALSVQSIKKMLREAIEDNDDEDLIQLYRDGLEKATKDFKAAVNA